MRPVTTEFERTLPHDLEAERSILGAILLHNDAIDVVPSLATDHFFRVGHGRIFSAMLALREDGSAIDLVTLRAAMAATGDLGEAGGPAYLAALVDGMPRASNIEHYTAIVTEHHRRRQAIGEAHRLTAHAYDADQDTGPMIGDAAERLLALCGSAAAGRAVPLSEIAPVGVTAIMKAQAAGTLVTGTPTGFVELDDMLSGLHPADLCIIAARTSVGKTSLAMNIARNVALSTGPVLVHSCEMSKEQLFLRLLAAEARLDSHMLRAGNVAAADWEKVARAAETLGNAPLFIDDMAQVTCREVRARARNLRASLGMLSLIVVDYLQLMRGTGKFDSRQQEIGTISRGLKAIGKELAVPVVALSQLSRAPEGRSDKRPQLSDLRESGDIENDADTVLFIFRPGDAASIGTADIIVGKQRNGPVGKVRLAFLDYCTRFDNLHAVNVPN